jgi:hypothetical protein
VAVDLRDRTEHGSEDRLLLELERLWAASPGERPQSRGLPIHDVLVRALVLGWPAVMLTIYTLAPAAAPNATYPAWAYAAGYALLVGPLVAGLLGLKGQALAGLGLSTGLAGLGIGVGIACSATSHHMGAWWMAETAMFAGLAALSVACLALKLRA